MNESTRPVKPCPLCTNPRLRFDPYPSIGPVPRLRQQGDNSGRAHLDFYNVDLSGGYRAVVTETGEPYDSHLCFINGVPCHADEARFGGIVIQVQQHRAD